MAKAKSESESSSSMAAEGMSLATSMMVPTTGWMVLPDMMMASSGASNSTAGGSQSGRSRTSSRSSGRSNASIKGEMAGASTSEGFTEGIVPVFKDLPGAVHGLENVRYLAALELRSLARGNAFISYVGIEGWKGARGQACRACRTRKRRPWGSRARGRQYSMRARPPWRRPTPKRRWRSASKKLSLPLPRSTGRVPNPVHAGRVRRPRKRQLLRSLKAGALGRRSKRRKQIQKRLHVVSRNQRRVMHRRLVAWQVTIRSWNYLTAARVRVKRFHRSETPPPLEAHCARSQSPGARRTASVSVIGTLVRA